MGEFVKGEGYVGLSLDGDPQITGYSAAEGLDRQGLAANFTETETSSVDSDFGLESLVLSAYLLDPTTNEPYKALSA